MENAIQEEVVPGLDDLEVKAEQLPAAQRGTVSRIADANPESGRVVGLADQMMDAIMQGASPEQLESIYSLYERVRKDEAERAYRIAMANVQSMVPTVRKNKRNNHTNSSYADLAAVLDALLPIAGAEGIAVQFKPQGMQGDFLVMRAEVSHRAGHVEFFEHSLPVGGAGMKGNTNMTPTHANASAVSYLRRYLLTMIFNIATSDDDGNNCQEPKTRAAIGAPKKFDLNDPAVWARAVNSVKMNGSTAMVAKNCEITPEQEAALLKEAGINA